MGFMDWLNGMFAQMFAKWGNKEMRLLMLGLDAAGKTTVLYRMKLGEVLTRARSHCRFAQPLIRFTHQIR